ncbi:MAG: YitT family protein, partial [Pseudomonadota bacterium]
VLLGIGLLAMFRHRASLGGVGILALYLQDRFRWRAGWVQMAIDLCILATAFAVTEPWLVALSVVSAVILNLVLAVNHREDRYVAR